MKILALDTATEFCSCALLHDAEIAERLVHAGQTHSEILIGMIRDVMAERGLSLGELDAIAATVGPGSFTGVRIAAAVAQGLAFGAGLPVVAIGTLEAIAAANTARRIVVATDARMGEIYCAAFERVDDQLRVLWGPVLAKPDAPPALIGEDYVGLGSGFAAYEELLCRTWNGKIAQVINSAAPAAKHVALLAAQRVGVGQVGTADTLHPIYVRDKVALTLAER